MTIWMWAVVIVVAWAIVALVAAAFVDGGQRRKPPRPPGVH